MKGGGKIYGYKTNVDRAYMDDGSRSGTSSIRVARITGTGTGRSSLNDNRMRVNVDGQIIR